MGELSKLKVAVAQPELVDGEPSHNRATRERMMAQAIDAGADLLVMPGSLADEGAVHLVALNDSRIDVAGDVVALEAAGERYRISVGGPRPGCDFHVCADLSPWTCMSTPRFDKGGIVLRPTGMAEFDGVKLNVQSDGEFIPKDVLVKVERVEGARIVVRRTA